MSDAHITGRQIDRWAGCRCGAVGGTRAAGRDVISRSLTCWCVHVCLSRPLCPPGCRWRVQAGAARARAHRRALCHQPYHDAQATRGRVEAFFQMHATSVERGCTARPVPTPRDATEAVADAVDPLPAVDVGELQPKPRVCLCVLWPAAPDASAPPPPPRAADAQPLSRAIMHSESSSPGVCTGCRCGARAPVPHCLLYTTLCSGTRCVACVAHPCCADICLCCVMAATAEPSCVRAQGLKKDVCLFCEASCGVWCVG
jgi:hypothetical protein